MFRQLFKVLSLTLALNFLALAGAVAWLWQSGRLDRDKITAIKALLDPKPPPAAPAAAPAPAPATRPAMRLEDLLKRHAGLPITEQVELVRRSFDAQMAILDRRAREIEDRQRSLDAAQRQLASDRTALAQRERTLQDKVQEAARLANDKGFQDSLERYQALPARQVKTIFLGLDDDTVVRYLTTMEPRTAAKILKEFKAPDEVERAKSLMEKMRLAQLASGKE